MQYEINGIFEKCGNQKYSTGRFLAPDLVV